MGSTGPTRVIHLTSCDALRNAAASWDDLWWRSESANPLVRAELVARWVERFAPRRRFEAVVVEDAGRWVAALALVASSPFGALGIGRLTANPWSFSGDVLVEPGGDTATILERLLAALRQAGWRLLCLDGVHLASPRWRAFLEAAKRLGMAAECRVHYQSGLIRLCHDRQRFLAALPKNHRNKLARCMRRIAERGPVRLEYINRFSPEEVEPLVRRAFELEDRGWKGQAGTSVLRNAGMFDYYLGQARQLARCGHLELAFLWCGDLPASFVYGAMAKGISFWGKIGYDPALRCCTPGQLLQGLILDRFQDDPDRCAVDIVGPVTDALARWQPEPYPVGRMVVALDGLVGRLGVWGCRHAAPWLRWLRGRQASVQPGQSAVGKPQAPAGPVAKEPAAPGL